MQNGLPYSATVTGYVGDAIRARIWNGAAVRLLFPAIGLNTYKTPRKMWTTFDLEKDFKLFTGKYDLELFAQMFNVANHQNYRRRSSTTAYKLSGATVTAQNLRPSRSRRVRSLNQHQ